MSQPPAAPPPEEFPEVPPDRADRDPWWTLGYGVLGPLFHLLFRIRYRGRQNIPPEGGVILASNHISVLDPVIIAMAVTTTGRAVRFLAAAEFFRKPVIGWGLRRIRQIPIRRGASDRRALEHAARVIRRGALAGIFPEGTLSPDGELLPGRRGAARIALASDVPILPCGIWGTRARWPRGGIRLRRPLRPRVMVSFGPVIEPAGELERPNDVQAYTERIMAAIGEQVAIARAAVEG
ncbi:MAG TPA: lysophospholipid acyltransferase family protein [Actinomycetota bacterium]|nr:lysophospholipid acyltransferase family protein [Actinomycetota bacterium]